MRQASDRIPVEIWREIFSYVFEARKSEEPSSSSLIHILDPNPQHPSDNPHVAPYVLLSRYFAPIIEEILFTRVFLRASRCEAFLVAVAIQTRVGGLKRGHYCKSLTIYDNDCEVIQFSALTAACPRLQSLRIDGYRGLLLEVDGTFLFRPPSDSIQALYLDLEGLTWDHLRFVSLNFHRLRHLRIVKWPSTKDIGVGSRGALKFHYLTHFSITEAFSATVDAISLDLPSLVHLGVDAPSPIPTFPLMRYLARYGKNLHTLDLRSPNMKPQYNFLYQYIHKYLSYCPVVETLVLSYPKTYPDIAYQSSGCSFRHAFVNRSLRRVIMTDFTRHSDLRHFQDLGAHLSSETYPGIQSVYVTLSPTHGSKVAGWIIQEARKRFFSTEHGTLQFEGLMLPYM
jgi:hypothetical protein